MVKVTGQHVCAWSPRLPARVPNQDGPSLCSILEISRTHNGICHGCQHKFDPLSDAASTKIANNVHAKHTCDISEAFGLKEFEDN